MRIKKIKILNYRQFKNFEVVFPKKRGHKDFFVLIGVMGTGKSNFLNAINWCLYKEEPFLSKPKEQINSLPVPNIKTLEEAECGQEFRVSVELHLEIEEELGESETLILTRDKYYKKIADNKLLEPQGKESFTVMRVANEGTQPIAENEEAENWVNRLIPKNIKDYFFFDGERLDKYFRETTGQHIQNAIYQVSDIEILEITKDHLKKIGDDYRNEIKKLCPEIEPVANQIKETESKLADIKKEIEDYNNQIRIASEEIEKLEEYLRDSPEVGSLQTEKEKLLEEQQEFEERFRKKEIEKRRCLYSIALSVYLKDAIDYLKSDIEQKIVAKELPPTIDKNFLEQLLQDKRCICQRAISEGSPEQKVIQELLEKIHLSKNLSLKLMSLRSLLADKINDQDKLDDLRKFSEELEQLRAKIRQIQERIQDIDSKICGYNVSEIIKKRHELEEYSVLKENTLLKLGRLQNQEAAIEKELEKLKKDFDQEISHQNKCNILNRYRDFVEKAKNILDQTEKQRLSDIRTKISNKTNELFLHFHWKKQTFKEIKIKEDYSVIPITVDGRSHLGTLSGGERVILALAFSLALQEISGFDANIIIDHPFANISGDSKCHIINVFSEISQNKQVILLLTPDEFTGEVENILSVNAVFCKKLRLDEKDVSIRFEGD